jgi:hypothetical protein
LVQLSVVQGLPSPHSLLLAQQPAIGAALQNPPLQLSAVQALPSSQSLSALQATTLVHKQRYDTQEPLVAPVLSSHSASVLQQAGFKPLGSLYMAYWHLPDRHLSEEQLLLSSQSLVE